MWLLPCLVLVGCGGADAPPPVDDPPPVVPATMPPVIDETPQPEPESPPVSPPEQTAGGLPTAESVLPSGEVSRGSLVVQESGYRYQIHPELSPVAGHPSGARAFSGQRAGMLGPVTMTVWATSEPFVGTLPELVTREEERARTTGGTVSDSEASMIMVAGSSRRDGHRFVVGRGDDAELVVLAVHGGQAYVWHCELTGGQNVWISAGSDCMIKGVTLHVAPPVAP